MCSVIPLRRVCVCVWVCTDTHSAYMLLAYREKKVQKVTHQNVEIRVVVMRGVLTWSLFILCFLFMN